VLAALGASVGAGPSTGEVPTGPTALGDQNLRPNIILIMTDDMAKADLSSMPSVHSLLAIKGTSFRHALTPFSLCCPDRVTMLTGQYAHNHGVLGNATSDFPLGGYAGFTSDNNTVVAARCRLPDGLRREVPERVRDGDGSSQGAPGMG
jgi:hypothetical protein